MKKIKRRGRGEVSEDIDEEVGERKGKEIKEKLNWEKTEGRKGRREIALREGKEGNKASKDKETERKVEKEKKSEEKKKIWR